MDPFTHLLEEYKPNKGGPEHGCRIQNWPNLHNLAAKALAGLILLEYAY